MCSSKPKLEQPTQVNVDSTPTATMVSDINGRPVLQPATSNRVLAKNSLKKTVQVPPSPLYTASTLNPKTNNKNNSPISPKLKSPRTPAIKRSNINRTDSTSSISERLALTPPTKCTTIKTVNKGSIAAARREQVEVMKVQRKLKIAHYGRLTSAKYDSCSKLTSLFDPNSLINTTNINNNVTEEKRCSFITPFSDPIYVAYHDEEWGVPIHDDKLLFELLVLTVAQVGSDWTKVLKNRQQFREAFSGFVAETVSKFTDKDITAISTSYGIEVGFIRGVVDNSNCILEIKKAFGSFDKYIWGFVNHRPIATNYKLNHKMPVKTSKSEAISKDMLRRGFRQIVHQLCLHGCAMHAPHFAIFVGAKFPCI
nr:DNA glycosylase [Tanacetum cinerariifolium]